MGETLPEPAAEPPRRRPRRRASGPPDRTQLGGLWRALLRLGLEWVDAELPARIVRRTGGYPDLIQAVCDQVLVELRQHRTLTLTAAQLDVAESSGRVRERLVWSFRNNTDKAGQMLGDGIAPMPLPTSSGSIPGGYRSANTSSSQEADTPTRPGAASAEATRARSWRKSVGATSGW